MKKVLRSCHVALTGVTLLISFAADAVITTGVIAADLPTCDVLAVPGTVDELGNPPAFPGGELIASIAGTLAAPACPTIPDSALLANALVSITNLNAIAFIDLWYVADPGTVLDNVDGLVNGMPAFKIDAIGIAFATVGVPDVGVAASGSIIALPVPEPASAALLGLGLLALSAARRRAGA